MEIDFVLIFHVSIDRYRGIQARERKTQAKAVYLLNKLHMESIVTAQSQNLFIFETWNSII